MFVFWFVFVAHSNTRYFSVFSLLRTQTNMLLFCLCGAAVAAV